VWTLTVALRERRAAVAVEFAVSGLALFAFVLVLLNMGLLGLSVGALAHGVQAAARTAAVQAAKNYVNSGSTYSCPTPASVATYFNNVANPPLPPSGTSAATSNPYINAVWTNNSSNATAGEPPGVYITLTGTYVWHPIGFNFGPGVTLKITTLATVLGSASGTAAVDASC
jgi:hypothetical protein